MKQADQKNKGYQPTFSVAFLHPRFWGLWCVLGLMAVSIYLPGRLRRTLGAGLGNLFRLYNHKRRRTVLINLQLCFPAMTDAEREQMMHRHFRCYGQGVFDCGLLWWANKEHLAKWVHWEGLDNLKQAVNSGQAVILLSYHSSNIESITGVSQLVSAVTPMKSLCNPLLNYFLCRGVVSLVARYYFVTGV